MNIKLKSIIENFSYSLTSNLVSMIVSTLIVLIVPKLIGIQEYGYWQLYIFYTSYIGFLNIGWVEGIYLRYGGVAYNKLDKNIFSAQFWCFVLYTVIIVILISIYSLVGNIDYEKKFIIQMLSVCILISVPRGLLMFILQATNRIKEFSKINLVDRLTYCIIVIIMVFLGVREYRFFIVADLFGKFLTLIWVIYSCKEIVFHKMSSIKVSCMEIIKNVSVGIKLMFANIASMLIIGIIRLGIENSWSVEIFGKVSLTMSISNLMMIFINAIAIIMFPILRRSDQRNLKNIYTTIRDFLMITLFAMLLLYYPLRFILVRWLPEYKESLMYMSLLFPMCVFEGKMALLINTYLKTLRKENLMLNVNLVVVVASIVLTFINTRVFYNLDLTVISIVFLSALRCIITEIYLAIYLNVKIKKDVILELILTFIFILTGWFSNSWITILIYIICYLLYLIIKKNDIISSKINIKKLAGN